MCSWTIMEAEAYLQYVEGQVLRGAGRRGNAFSPRSWAADAKGGLTTNRDWAAFVLSQGSLRKLIRESGLDPDSTTLRKDWALYNLLEAIRTVWEKERITLTADLMRDDLTGRINRIFKEERLGKVPRGFEQILLQWWRSKKEILRVAGVDTATAQPKQLVWTAETIAQYLRFFKLAHVLGLGRQKEVRWWALRLHQALPPTQSLGAAIAERATLKEFMDLIEGDDEDYQDWSLWQTVELAKIFAREGVPFCPKSADAIAKAKTLEIEIRLRGLPVLKTYLTKGMTLFDGRDNLLLAAGLSANPRAQRQDFLDYQQNLRTLQEYFMKAKVDRVKSKYPSFIDEEELWTGALEGWTEALQKYDGRGTLSGFAQSYMTRRIIDRVRSASLLNVREMQLLRQYEDRVKEYERDEPLDENDIFDDLGWDLNDRNTYAAARLKSRVQTLDRRYLETLIGDEDIEHTAEDELENEKFWQVVAENFTGDERKLFLLHYRDGLIVKDLSTMLGIPRQDIKSQLERILTALQERKQEIQTLLVPPN